MTRWLDRLDPRARGLLTATVMVWATLATLATSAPPEVARSATTTVEVDVDPSVAERRLRIHFATDGWARWLKVSSSPRQTLVLISPTPTDAGETTEPVVVNPDGSLEVQCRVVDCSEVVVAVQPRGVSVPTTVLVTVEAVATGSTDDPPGITELVVEHE